MSVTSEMLAEQAAGLVSHEVDVLTDDAVGFDHSLPEIKSGLNGNSLYELFMTRFAELRPPAELFKVTSIDDAERLAANPGNDAVMLDQFTYWRYPTRLAELMALPSSSGGPVRNERHETRDQPGPIVHLRPWRWPGIALLWRAHALIALEPDAESDTAALTALQYAQAASTFEQLCGEPDQRLTAQETFQALQMLWWMEAQTSGRETADEHARRRAVAWDRGITCEFEGERMHRLGRTGAPLHAAEVCNAWRSVPAAHSPALRPYRFKDLVLDFSHRSGACPQFPNNGAFQ